MRRYWSRHVSQLSEGQPPAELKHSIAASPGDSTEIDVVDTQLRIVVIPTVQRVEHVHANLQTPRRSEREILCDRRVDVLRAGSAGHVQHVGPWPQRGIRDSADRNTCKARRVQI